MPVSQLLTAFEQVCERYSARLSVLSPSGQPGESASYDEVRCAAQSLAVMLQQKDPQRRVALLVPPSANWVKAFWGIVMSGSLLVPLVELHPASEHARALAAARVDTLLVASELLGRAHAALSHPDYRLARASDTGPAPSVLTLERLLGQSAPSPRLAPDISGDTPAVLFFTSGTTGKPKAALVSHDQLAAVGLLVGKAWGMRHADRLVHCLPLHHTHGLSIAFVTAALGGASQVLLRRFEPEQVWREFSHSSVFMGVPTMHKRLLDLLDQQEPALQSQWRQAARQQRLITSGSAALPVGLAERWQAIIGQIPLERFGMTEVGVALSNPLTEARRLGSCGRVLPGMQVRIVDDSGCDVAPGAAGEIWIRGPSVFSGYDGDPEATRASFHDGWFKSGDTATWLEDGFVKTLGRTSVDILKSGGYKLSALEIEEAVRRYPGVDEVAVVGVPDADWGDRVVAVVVGAAPIESGAVREFLKSELAPYKVPRTVVQVSALPRNALGKVTKHVLVEQLTAFEAVEA